MVALDLRRPGAAAHSWSGAGDPLADVRADQVVDVASCTPGLERGRINCETGGDQIGGVPRPRSCFDVGLGNAEHHVASMVLGLHERGSQLGTAGDPRVRARMHGSPFIYVGVDEHEVCDRTFGHTVFVGGLHLTLSGAPSAPTGHGSPRSWGLVGRSGRPYHRGVRVKSGEGTPLGTSAQPAKGEPPGRSGN